MVIHLICEFYLNEVPINGSDFFWLFLISTGDAKSVCIIVGRVSEIGCHNYFCKLLKGYYRHRQI